MGADDELETVKAEAIRMGQAMQQTPPSNESELSESSHQPPKKKPKADGLGAVLKKAFFGSSQSESIISSEDRVHSELEKYKILPSVDMDSDTLVWWKSLSSFPKKYLCICGTSVSSECLFSQAEYIVNPLRARLTPD